MVVSTAEENGWVRGAAARLVAGLKYFEGVLRLASENRMLFANADARFYVHVYKLAVAAAGSGIERGLPVGCSRRTVTA